VDNPRPPALKESVPIRWTKALFWAYLLILIWTEATSFNPADPDLWHRLALGEMLWKTGHFPLGDTFSYLADYQHVADHEWGSGLLFYAAYQCGGGSAIVLLKLATLALTMVLLGLAGLQSRPPTVLLAVFYGLILLALLPAFQSTLRCMAFTNIFFALWLLWFQRERHAHPIPTWAYIASIIVWANLHGGFAIGLAWLLALTLIPLLAGQPWKKEATRFVLCFLATLVNPFGWHLWISTARALLATRRGFPEWAPVVWWPDVADYLGYKLLLLGVIGAFAFLLTRRDERRLDFPSLLLIAAFLVLSLVSVRHTPLFAIVVGALLPDLLPHEPPVSSILHPVHRLGYLCLRFALLLVPLYAGFMLLPGDGLELGYPSVSCPVHAVDFLEHENCRGRLLVPFNYGSYALWRLRGHMRVSMDGRYDLVYRPETYQKVEDFFFARPGWPALLHSPPPNAVLVPRVDPVYAKLKTQPGWLEVYRDPTDAVFQPR